MIYIVKMVRTAGFEPTTPSPTVNSCGVQGLTFVT